MRRGEKQGLEGPAWPEKFPVPGKFRTHPVWLRFRAESLADWVNQDAAAFRAVAGRDAYIAVDYLETCGSEMPRRNGNSVQFLEALTSADIIQPKPLMAEVDDHWLDWQKEIAAQPAVDARPATRPNILFIFSDDHAQHALSCYGSNVNSTPHLDRLAQEGARFPNSFVTNSICTPSRATLLTGQYSRANGVPVFNAFDGSRDHVAKPPQAGRLPHRCDR